ncbi:uncharacterized protein LOC121429110 [Lytechinus variegatus]|uniref:uncharacterized protein LOC121429110 n=1 Tax=Lytechinus variegatus TaxID=7654 RepID=UPI001BB19CFC|nr:uncharacterized protein LOC121429110 [Lytechinus variegatus]
MEHYFMLIVGLIASTGIPTFAETLEFQDILTCEHGDGNHTSPLDLTCPNRDHPFSCKTEEKTCRCDSNCFFFEDCCPDIEGNAPISNRSNLFNKLFKPYITCSGVIVTYYSDVPPTNSSYMYYLISKCPEYVSSESTVKQNCELSSDAGSDVMITPIYVRGVGHFKNIYCVVCHGIKPQPSDLHVWRWNWDCERDVIVGDGSEYSTTDTEFDEPEIPPNFDFKGAGCKHYLKYTENFSAQECVRVDVSMCSSSFSSKYRAQVKCPPYLAPIKYHGTTYKNLACLYCNVKEDEVDICTEKELLCRSVEPPQRVSGEKTGIGSLSDYFVFGNNAAFRRCLCKPDQFFNEETRQCQDIHCPHPFSEYSTKSKVCEDLAQGFNTRLSFNACGNPQTSLLSLEDTTVLWEIVDSLILDVPYNTLSVIRHDRSRIYCNNIDGHIDSIGCISGAKEIECRVYFQYEKDSLPDTKINHSEHCSSDGLLIGNSSYQHLPSFGNICVTSIALRVELGCEIMFSTENECSSELFQRTNATRDSTMSSEILSIVSLIGSIFSMIALLFVIITYSMFSKLRTLAGKSLLCLCSALFVSYLLIALGNVSRNIRTLCIVVAVFNHFFLLSFFFWMNALALDFCRTFGTCATLKRRSYSQKSFIKFSLYAWGTPAAIVGVGLFIDKFTSLDYAYGSSNHGGGEICWLNANWYSVLFGVGLPMAGLLIMNVALFIDTVIGIKQQKKAGEMARKSESSAVQKTAKEVLLFIKICSVMGLTWLLVFIKGFVDNIWLSYFFVVVNSLQGVYILITFGRSRKINTLWKEKLGIKTCSPKSSNRTTNYTRFFKSSSSKDESL